jgi:hypothetical protein
LEALQVDIQVFTSMYEVATSECFSLVGAMKVFQKIDHHSNKKLLGASIAATPDTDLLVQNHCQQIEHLTI